MSPSWWACLVSAGVAALVASSAVAGCSLGLDDIPDPKADGGGTGATGGTGGASGAGGTGGACKPRTCADASADCGYILDNCGAVTFCGECALGQYCGDPAVGPNRCGTNPCTPTGCGTHCGLVSNGCDSVIDCLGCPSSHVCGGPQQECVCAKPDPTCEDLGAECGYIPQPCNGAPKFCGLCTGGQTCGAAGKNKCGTGACTPRGPCVADTDCGKIPDGCEGQLDCGACSSGACGEVSPNKCGCAPPDCGTRNCGTVTNACGESKDCGACTAPQACGGHPKQPIPGVPGYCGCVRQTCATLGAECGSALDDQCGGTVACGPDTCPNNAVCGLFVPGVCACAPANCGTSTCGDVFDSCGNAFSCGDCTDQNYPYCNYGSCQQNPP